MTAGDQTPRDSARESPPKSGGVVGLVGFGQLGSVLASRLRAAGHRLRVFDLDVVAQGLAREGGFDVASSLPDVASGADVLLLCLPDALAVEEVIAGEAGVGSWQPAPSVCVDLTSSLPGVTKRMGALLNAHSVDMVDAPVSGGVAGARAGALTVMAGGDEDLVDGLRPLLAAFASNVVWSGPLGTGHATKAFNNALSATSFIATGETLAAARMLGIPAGQALDAINRGGHGVRTAKSSTRATS
jgi:3-hydroxyisobutyrate dehydrogenase